MRQFFAIVLATISVMRVACPVHAGQAALMPVEDFVSNAMLVGIVQVTNVVKIEVPTLEGQVSHVYVAEAELLEAVKNDYPNTKKRRIAIVGSTVPRSSAVWQPIEKGTYLAFLKREQGHYHYQFRYAFRKVDENNKVDWIDFEDRKVEFERITTKEAMSRLRAIQKKLK